MARPSRASSPAGTRSDSEPVSAMACCPPATSPGPSAASPLPDPDPDPDPEPCFAASPTWPPVAPDGAAGGDVVLVVVVSGGTLVEEEAAAPDDVEVVVVSSDAEGPAVEPPSPSSPDCATAAMTPLPSRSTIRPTRTRRATNDSAISKLLVCLSG